MNGKLRNMTSVYLWKDDKFLLLYRQEGKVVNNVWTGSARGHFEEHELNDAKACVLREMKEELGIDDELTSNEGICKWFGIDEVCNLEMPYTAKYTNAGILKISGPF